MTDKEKLYETLGELLYAVAMADGIIQDEEIKVLEEIVENHQWGSTIAWSFNYEFKKHHSIEEVYDKVINYCHGHGPAPEYAEFIDVMETLAEVSDGIDDEEEELINRFSKDLTARFKKDLEKIGKN